jgi:hypothetical protein
MDVPFLKTTIEAYIAKNRMRERLNSNDVFEEVYSLVTLIREQDIELYHKLYDTGRMTQVSIIDDYLNMTYREDELDSIKESIGLGIGLTLSAIVMYLKGEPLTRAGFKILDKIASGFEKLGAFLSRRGRYWKFSYAIIRQNADKCYKKCGIKEEDITSMMYFSTRSNTHSKMPASGKSLEKGNCLAECYVNSTIEVIALTTKSYFVCLKKTGDFSVVEKLRPDDTIKIISGLKLSSACDEYYKEMQYLFKEFNQLLDHVYGNNRDEKQKALIRLRNSLIEARNQISKTNDVRRFN